MRRDYYDEDYGYGPYGHGSYGYGSYGRGRGMAHQDGYAQAAGALGALTIILGALMVAKEKLGLGWPAMTLLTAGTLVVCGWLAWQVRKFLVRLFAPLRPPAKRKRAATALAAESAEEVPQNEELTGALRRAGAIGRDELIRRDRATTSRLPAVPGTLYRFEMPGGRTHEDIARRLGQVASALGVTRLHLQLDRSRESEREVRLLKLDDPPFSSTFPPPSRQEIRDYPGIPLGYEVTGNLGGVPTFDKASMLVGGMTQTGKTTVVNGLLTCLLIAYGSDFDLYLLDGKMCGLTKFEKIAARYEASSDPAVMESLLDDLLGRVDRRYDQIQDAIRNRQPEPTFKRVFFIVDEAADFYADDGTKESKEQVRRVEDKSRSLVAKSLESRVVTIMLTQRPSKEAIPVKVRDQFLYRMCLYVPSEGGAKVVLGDSYFDTVSPIHPALLDPSLKGQAVLFAGGSSTLIRGFRFDDEFIWSVVDEVAAERKVDFRKSADSPLKQAVEMMQTRGVEFLPTSELAEFLGITEQDPTERGKRCRQMLGVPAAKGPKGVRGYKLADLSSAAMSDS